MAVLRNLPPASPVLEASFNHSAKRGCIRRSPNQLARGRPISGFEFLPEDEKKVGPENREALLYIGAVLKISPLLLRVGCLDRYPEPVSLRRLVSWFVRT